MGLTIAPTKSSKLTFAGFKQIKLIRDIPANFMKFPYM
jgi:hypothetical protein